jgi:lysophospholipase L1-like esterase
VVPANDTGRPGAIAAPRRAGIWKLLGIVGLALVVGLGLAELLLRLVGLVPTEGVVTVNASDFERIPGIFAPNQRLVVRQIRALPYRVSIDSLGYRGTPFLRQRPPGETRVLFVGDSFVHGDFVDNEQTLPAQLERLLGRSCQNVRVINGGLGGSTIVDQRHLVMRALEVSPDLVIVLFSENDVADLARPTTMWEQLRANRELKSHFPMSLVYGSLRNTAMWNLALAVRGRMNASQGAEASPAAPITSDSDRGVARLRDRYKAALLETRDSLRVRNIPLVFVAFPAHLTVSGAWEPNQIRWAMNVASEAGIPAFDLLPVLQELRVPAESLFLLPHDGHPSATGYGVGAAHLAEKLVHGPPLSGACRNDKSVVASKPSATPRY